MNVNLTPPVAETNSTPTSALVDIHVRHKFSAESLSAEVGMFILHLSNFGAVEAKRLADTFEWDVQLVVDYIKSPEFAAFEQSLKSN